jgi:hypothetical protein
MKAPKSSDFWRRQVYGRRYALLRDPSLYVALSFGVLTTLLTPYLPFHSVQITDLAGVGLAYAALSFGAAVSGCILALGIPGPDRLKKWSRIPSSNEGFPALSELVFVFAWAAMSQLGVVLICFLAFVFGAGFQLLPDNAIWTHVGAFAIAMTVCYYALLELIAVVRTLVQVATAIIGEEARPDS